MRCVAIVVGAALLTVCSAQETTPSSEHALLNKLSGHWVMRGTIGNRHTTHDVNAKWILNEEYLQVHEVSRERRNGKPQYEALLTLVADPKTGQIACDWLDTTGISLFNGDQVGRGKQEGDRIDFNWGDANDGIHTVFAYDRGVDSWTWNIDNLIKGKTQPFARLTLTRR